MVLPIIHIAKVPDLGVWVAAVEGGFTYSDDLAELLEQVLDGLQQGYVFLEVRQND